VGFERRTGSLFPSVAHSKKDPDRDQQRINEQGFGKPALEKGIDAEEQADDHHRQQGGGHPAVHDASFEVAQGLIVNCITTSVSGDTGLEGHDGTFLDLKVDFYGVAAHFAVFDVALGSCRHIQDHGDTFAAVRTVEVVFLGGEPFAVHVR
jgi:hypothetical protein